MEGAIAIIGVSARMPSANSPEEFWKVLSSGTDAVIPKPKDRNTNSRTFNTEKCRPIEAGFLKCRVDEFDAKFFGISPREAVFMDPQQRLLLEVSWESLEDAGINPLMLKGSDTGVYVGIWQMDYAGLLPVLLPPQDAHHRYIGNAFSATASRISYFLGLHGPNLAVESGCSSALSAIHQACEGLRHGYVSLALAGASNLILDEVLPLSFVLSPDQRCKTFDESANGFVRAETCGMFVLKRYIDAVKDEDSIHAIIRGSAMNNDGAGSSFGTPNSVAQEAVIRSALKSSGIKPSEISMIEAHGTGTAVGDPTEVGALGKIYSEGRTQPVWLSSVKSNMGHAESAAGFAGVLKVMLCFKNNAIPPHLHLKRVNERIHLDQIPAIIPTGLTPWKGEDRIAAVSSFSMSGTNVHLLVQEPPKLTSDPSPQKLVEEYNQVVLMSAKSQAVLEAMRKSYLFWSKSNPDLNIEDVAYGMNTNKASFPYRLGLTARNVKEFAAKLEQHEFHTSNATGKPRIAFLFTGQGSQYVGMAKNLYQTSQIFAQALKSYDTKYDDVLGVSLFEVIWGSADFLSNALYCQPAIFCVQVALIQLWKSFGVFPDVVVGHSVGEFAAAVTCGFLSFEDAFTLVAGRSRLVSQLPPGGMLAIKAEQRVVQEIIQNFEIQHPGKCIDIAAVNSSSEIVLSGDESAISVFQTFAKGTRMTKISTSHAFHSREMEPCLEEFGEIVRSVQIQISTSGITYISGTTGKSMMEEGFGKQYWQKHLRQCVNFEAALKTLAEQDCNIFLEIGAQPILTALAMAEHDGNENLTYLPSLRKAEENSTTLRTTLIKLYLAGVELDWKQWFCGNRKGKISLPFYPFQRTRFWYEQNESEDGVGRFNLTTPLVNPLLGRHLQLPTPDTIFTSKLRTADPSFSYLKDHKVGQRVILPGAAYLEFILASAGELEMGDGVPLTVENLSIEKALSLESATTLVTVISKLDEFSHEVKVYQEPPAKNDGEINWKLQVRGRLRRSRGVVVVPKSVDLNEIMLGLKERADTGTAYQRIAQSGIQFGPQFSSIENVWAGDSELLAAMRLPVAIAQDYTCHPILLDGMIQSYAFRDLFSTVEMTPFQNKLYLPIGIRKFSWYYEEMSPVLYAHTTWNRDAEVNSNVRVALYNEDGKLVALMENPEFIQTTVEALLRQLDRDKKSKLPQMWEGIWKPNSKLNARQIETSSLMLPKVLPSLASLLGDIHSAVAVRERSVAAQEINGIFLYVLLRAALECNWRLELGTTFKSSKLSLPPKLKSLPVLKTWLQILCKSGYLLEQVSPDESESEFCVTREIPSIAECDRMISSIITEVEDAVGLSDATVLFSKRIEENFTDVLRGTMEPLALLYPKDENDYSAFRFHSEAGIFELNAKLMIQTFMEILGSVDKNSGSARVLEVGAGNGAATKDILEALFTLGQAIEYDFTDISPYFFPAAKKQLGQIDFGGQVSINYKILNMEEDPLAQGFVPESYDILLAVSVLHFAADLAETLSNLKLLLRPGGILIFVEQFTEPAFAAFSFSLLEGWWRKKDFRETTLVDGKGWSDCLLNSNFEDVRLIDEMEGAGGVVVGRKPNTDHGPVTTRISEIPPKNLTWLLLGDESTLMESLGNKLVQYGRSWNPIVGTAIAGKGSGLKSVAIDQLPSILASFRNNSMQLEGIIYIFAPAPIPTLGDSGGLNTQPAPPAELIDLCKCYQKFSQENSSFPRLLGITRGVIFDEDTHFGNPNAAQLWGLLTTFINENPHLPVSLIDLDPDEVLGNPAEIARILPHLWTSDEHLARFTNGKVFHLRMREHALLVPLLIPAGPRFCLEAPSSKSIDDLQIIGVRMHSEALAPYEVELELRATSINFGDVILILRPDLIPAEEMPPLGMDVSGVVVRAGTEAEFQVGDEVIVFDVHGGCIRSHVVIPSAKLFRKPPGITFSGAATVACAFITSYASLVEEAKITSVDRVLIHAASCDNGLAAIQIAKHVGAEIYATAGTPRKRAYLRALGIKYVYHSRSTEYGDEIWRDTGGAGVTIVLNALTAPGFKEASLRVCAPGATFIQLVKADIWTKAEVQERRPDVIYRLVDAGSFKEKRLVRIKNQLEAKLISGDYRPLPHTIFPLANLKEAFHHFKKAKHIGKVVIKMPRLGNKKLCASWTHEVFSEKSTYLITGGLGGIGLEVANWMRNSGAQNIVLAGRSRPTVEAQALIDSWKADGTSVQAFSVDMADFDSVAAMLESIEKDPSLPPLRGVFHAAGVVADAIFLHQTYDSFNQVFRPKVIGAWNLHYLTLSYQLEFFVSFSTVSALLGTQGQSNYAAANRSLDSIIQYRRANGLPGTTINWGAWEGVGVAANVKAGNEGAIGVIPFTAAQGIATLEYMLTNQLSSMDVQEIIDLPKFKISMSIVGKIYEDVKIAGAGDSSRAQRAILLESLAESVRNFSPSEKRTKLLEDYLGTVLKQTLNIPHEEKLDPNQNWAELGIDSLMTIEFRNRLQSQLMHPNQVLTVMMFQENRTIRSLGKILETLLDTDVNAPSPNVEHIE